MRQEEMAAVTVQRIEQTLLALMVESPFDEITITDVISKSGMGRATFYRYFKTKSEILTSIDKRILSATNAEMQRLSETLPKNLAPVDYLIALLPTYYQFRDELKILWGPNSTGNYAVRLHMQFMPFIQTFFSPRPKVRNIPVDYALDIYTSTFVSLLLMWMQRPLPERPEEFGRIIKAISNTPISDLI